MLRAYRAYIINRYTSDSDALLYVGPHYTGPHYIGTHYIGHTYPTASSLAATRPFVSTSEGGSQLTFHVQNVDVTLMSLPLKYPCKNITIHVDPLCRSPISDTYLIFRGPSPAEQKGGSQPNKSYRSDQ